MKFAFSLFASSLALAAAQDLNLYETVAADAELSTLGAAIGLAGYEGYFTNTSDLTVFAPSNSAFDSLPGKFLTPGFLPHLMYLLEYHVIEGSVVASTDITDGMSIMMKNGENITAAVNDQGVFLSGAAFQNSQVVLADIISTNGIAHVVGGYFLPELLTMDLLALASMQEGFGNVVELIAASGLESELQADNITVLAPSNTAFEALPSDYLQTVAADTELRDNLLRYHVIMGSYPQALLMDGMEVMTALGAPLTFSVIGGGRFAQITAVGSTNNATLGIVDLFAANGMAHTIEGVLEPPADVPPTDDSGTPAPVAPSAPVATTMPAAPTPDAGPTDIPPTDVPPTTTSSASMIGGVVAVVVSVASALL